MLAALGPGQNLALRGAIAFELIGDDHPRDVSYPFEQLAEACLRGFLVPTALHQHVEHVAVLIHRIHRPPQVVAFTSNSEEHLIQRAIGLPVWVGGEAADWHRVSCTCGTTYG
jgi:hypothetical protein